MYLLQMSFFFELLIDYRRGGEKRNYVVKTESIELGTWKVSFYYISIVPM